MTAKQPPSTQPARTRNMVALSNMVGLPPSRPSLVCRACSADRGTRAVIVSTPRASLTNRPATDCAALYLKVNAAPRPRLPAVTASRAAPTPRRPRGAPSSRALQAAPSRVRPAWAGRRRAPEPHSAWSQRRGQSVARPMVCRRRRVLSCMSACHAAWPDHHGITPRATSDVSLEAGPV
jgi:hypothetical protein